MFQKGKMIYPVDIEVSMLLASFVDAETGELNCTEEEMQEAIKNVEIEFDKKIKELRNAYKDIQMEAKIIEAEAKALREEADEVGKRATSMSNRAERIKRLIAYLLQGEEFKKDGVSIGYRKSTSTEIDDGFIEWAREHAPQYLKEEVRKKDVLTALKNGEAIEFAHIKESRNIQIN